MVGFTRRSAFGRQPAPDDAAPEHLARALDASAEDLKGAAFAAAPLGPVRI